jgi:hypothetical protein
MSKMLEAALEYVHEGYAVVPLKPNKKTPFGKLVPNGHLEATADEAMIRKWWGEHPLANIGIRVGAEYDLLVIDVESADGHKKEAEKALAEGKTFGIEAVQELENKIEKLPRTRIVRTASGGLHYYFKFPEELRDLTLKKEIAPGVDLKTKGYVVAPPSVIRHGSYEREDEQE